MKRQPEERHKVYIFLDKEVFCKELNITRVLADADYRIPPYIYASSVLYCISLELVSIK